MNTEEHERKPILADVELSERDQKNHPHRPETSDRELKRGEESDVVGTATLTAKRRMRGPVDIDELRQSTKPLLT